jgi:O-antigen ligase
MIDYDIQFSQKFKDWVITLLILPIVVYLRFIGGTWLVHNNSYQESVINLVILAIVFGIWISWKIFFDDYFYLTGLEPYLGLLLLTIFCSTYFSSNFGLSFEITIGAVVFIGALYLLIDLCRSRQIWNGLINAILITGGINIVLIIGQVVYWFQLFGIQIRDLFYRLGYCLNLLPRLPNLPSMNSNVTAVYFLMIVPLGIFKITRTKSIIWKIVLCINTILSIIIIFLTRSRGGMIGFIVTCIAAAIIFLPEIKNLVRKNPGMMYIFGLFTIFLISFGVSYVIANRGFNISLDRNITARLQGWKTTWEIIKNNPFLGSGYGTFAENFLIYRDPEITSYVILHAHNEILQLAAQIGLLGVGVIFLILGVYSKKYLYWLPDPNHSMYNGDKFYLLSFAGFMGMGLVDSYLISANIQFLLLVIFVGMIPIDLLRREEKSRILIGCLLIVFVLVAGLDTWENWKLKPYHAARLSAYKGEWEIAEAEIAKAISRDGKNPYYKYAKAQIMGHKITTGTGDYEDTIQAYSQSIDLYPNWGPQYANLACLLYEYGSPQIAEENIRLANRYEPETSVYHCMLGDYLAAQNDFSRAAEEYRICLSLNPEWIDTIYWKYDPPALSNDQNETRQIREDVLSSLDEFDGLVPAYVAFYDKRFTESLNEIDTYLNQKPNDNDALLLKANILILENEYQEANDILRGIVDIHPRHSSAWLSLGKLELNAGNYEEALEALGICAAIESTTTVNLYLGLAYGKLGNNELEEYYYHRAAERMAFQTEFSNWVGYRFPIPDERISCIPELKTLSDYYTPFSTIVQELEQRNECLAYQIYQYVFEEYEDTSIFPELARISNLPKEDSNYCEMKANGDLE